MNSKLGPAKISWAQSLVFLPLQDSQRFRGRHVRTSGVSENSTLLTGEFDAEPNSNPPKTKTLAVVPEQNSQKKGMHAGLRAAKQAATECQWALTTELDSPT